MTPIMFIYKSIRKIHRGAQYLRNYVATKIKFVGNGVIHSSFSTNGCPFVFIERNTSSVCIGEKFRMNNHYVANQIGYSCPCTFRAFYGGSIFIGKNVGMSQTSLLACGADINVGDYTLMGGGVKVYTSDFHSMDYRKRRFPGKVDQGDCKCAPVTIGHDCFIGAGSIILKGVTIGDYSIVGAGSVVTKSVPKGEIWAGNPARFVKKINV